MARYRLHTSGVIDIENRKGIPADPENADWQEYQVWLGEGNTPDPIPEPAPLSAEERLRQTDREVVRWVDWLLQTLVQKGIINLAEIPQPVKDLYLERKTLRGQ